jgi:hypothetical protein
MEVSRYKVAGAAFVALLVTLMLATGASANPPAIVIPAGDIATLSNATFGDNVIDPGNCPANRLKYGYELGAGPNVELDTGVGCEPAAGATIGPFSTPTQLRVYLDDYTCPNESNPYFFYSDGSHALVTSTGPLTWVVSIMDSNSGCVDGPSVTRVPGAPGTGNFNVTVTLTPATPAGLCATLKALVASSPNGSSPLASALTYGACAVINQSGAARGVRKVLLIGQFDRFLTGLVQGGWLSPADAASLAAAANAL